MEHNDYILQTFSFKHRIIWNVHDTGLKAESINNIEQYKKLSKVTERINKTIIFKL